MNRIKALHDQGQSIWFDYIDRGLLQSGELASLVNAGVRGVTSNPSIFQQAMSSSDAYDEDLQRLSATDLSTTEIFETLAINDIQNAAYILRPVYDAANGHDGFVSLEVSPTLAYDTERTVEEALRLRAAVDRPNLMIKIPSTEQGVPAIRRLIAEGLNINVTLIFGRGRYQEVMEAYIAGLEDRVAKGLPVYRSASVASLFISRVDLMVDAAVDELDDADASQLKGKVAVANAKIAYADFKRTFAGPRWAALSAAGAKVQRPLWASTSTKNPSYPELLYVEPLIGPHTVNTMPPKTLNVFRENGVVQRTVDKDVGDAKQVLRDIADLGISLTSITDELEADGVRNFVASYEELLTAIEQRRNEIVMNG